MGYTRLNDDDIYDPAFVADVFDRCSSRYRTWSLVASFGLIHQWRKACVAGLDLPRDTRASGVDLMAGTGEVWPHLFARFPLLEQVTAVDISEGMHKEAMRRLHSARSERIEHLRADVLSLDLPEASADFAVSTFGLKTFNPGQHAQFASFLVKILKPGAPYSLIEATDPLGWWLRPAYRFYLDGVLPLVERTALRGARDFAMIGTYTRNFRLGETVTEALAGAGLSVQDVRYVGGSACRWTGRKPD